VSQGSQLTLLGRNANSSWAQVRLATGHVGWVNTAFIRAGVPIGSLPVTG
jgi:uncharacterized protein YgiM (DUF1202 family)